MGVGATWVQHGMAWHGQFQLLTLSQLVATLS